MRLRNVAPEAVKTIATLIDWRAYEIRLPGSERTTRHVVGYGVEDECVRVSAEISDVVDSSGLVTTSADHLFRLQGLSSERRDVRRVWLSWVTIQEAALLREVTGELVRLLGRLQ